MQADVCSRTILHSDLDAYYASVEAMLNPRLRGTAYAVCGKTEDRHGIVLAKSPLAKKAGIKTGMVNWEAERLCPGLKIVHPHYEEYVEYSEKTRSIYERYTDLVLQYGIDECYLDVTDSRLLFGSGRKIAERISRTVWEELGLTVSVGVSFCMASAKLASDMNKPQGITVIEKPDFEKMVWPLPVPDLFFVGRASTRDLLNVGIYTIGDLAKAQPEYLYRLFGKNGLMLWRFANGEDESKVTHKDFSPPIKTLGHGITCTSDLQNNEEVWRVVYSLAQDLGERLRVYRLMARGVQVSYRDKELAYKQFQTQLAAPSQSPYELALKGMELFERNYKWEKEVRSLCIRGINLIPKGTPVQLDLFQSAERRLAREKVEDAVYDIRRRYGKDAVYAASLMGDLKMSDERNREITMPGSMKA